MKESIKKLTYDKWKAMPEPAKAAVAFTFSSLTLKGIAFLTTPIFTRMMSSAQYGIISKYNSWNLILEVFALLGLTSAGVFNSGLNDYRDSRDQYISSVLSLCNISTIVVFAIVFLLKIPFGSGFILDNSLLLIMFVHFIFAPAQVFWITRQRYEYKYKLATFVSIMSAAISQLTAVMMVLHSESETAAFAKLLGTMVGGLVFSIPIYFMLHIKGKRIFNLAQWKEILIFALPLIPHYLAQHVMSGADRIMIADISSSSAAAIYSVVLTISLIATVIWSAINASLTPYVYEKLNQQEYASINNLVTTLVAVYGIMCVGVTLVAPEVMTILAPSEYKIGIYAVPPVAAVAFLNALYNIYAIIEFYHKKSKGIAVATMVSCIVNIVLNALLIPLFGFIAAAYTTLISNVVLILMHNRNYRKCQKPQIYNDKFILMLSAFIIGACEICTLLYLNTFVRYIFILLICVLAVLRRHYLIALYKSMKKAK